MAILRILTSPLIPSSPFPDHFFKRKMSSSTPHSPAANATEYAEYASNTFGGRLLHALTRQRPDSTGRIRVHIANIGVKDDPVVFDTMRPSSVPSVWYDYLQPILDWDPSVSLVVDGDEATESIELRGGFEIMKKIGDGEWAQFLDYRGSTLLQYKDAAGKETAMSAWNTASEEDTLSVGVKNTHNWSRPVQSRPRTLSTWNGPMQAAFRNPANHALLQSEAGEGFLQGAVVYNTSLKGVKSRVWAPAKDGVGAGVETWHSGATVVDIFVTLPDVGGQQTVGLLDQGSRWDWWRSYGHDCTHAKLSLRATYDTTERLRLRGTDQPW